LIETGIRDLALFELKKLVPKKRAVRESSEKGTFCLFPEFQFELKFRAFPYRGSVYPARKDIEQRPSCAGDLKITGRSASGDDRFSMDQ